MLQRLGALNNDNERDRIKKWPIVVSQIRLHKSKQKPFVVCCAEGIIPRFGEDGFQIVAKLSACQISGIRGEGFGKLHIKVLLTEGYPGEKMRFSMLGFSVNMFCASANQLITHL